MGVAAGVLSTPPPKATACISTPPEELLVSPDLIRMDLLSPDMLFRGFRKNINKKSTERVLD